MENKEIKKYFSLGIFLVLLLLSFFLLKPILMSIFAAIFLAFIFAPVYNWINKKIKNRNISAGIVCLSLILLIAIPLWFLIPVLLNQSIDIFRSSLSIDFITPLKDAFPQLFSSGELSAEIGVAIQSFVTNLTTLSMNLIADFLLEFPNLFLQWLVVLFTFFFVLRDHKQFVNYIQSILPFSKDLEKKFLKSTKDITSSILYGQILIGGLQGLLVGAGFFIFGVDNALFFTVLAVLAGVFPIVGATIVWIPVLIILFFQGEGLFTLVGITIFGILGSFFENSVKPAMVSRKTNIHSGVILIGMIGGVLLFGLLGFILGPLIFAYLIIFIETFRDRKVPGLIIKNPDVKF